jgi:hypothetical protein
MFIPAYQWPGRAVSVHKLVKSAESHWAEQLTLLIAQHFQSLDQESTLVELDSAA